MLIIPPERKAFLKLIKYVNKMEELLFKLLEQTPTIIALGVGIFAVWKEKKEDAKKFIEERNTLLESAAKERRENNARLEKIVEAHKTEIKEINAYVRERESEHLNTLKDIQNILEQILDSYEN